MGLDECSTPMAAAAPLSAQDKERISRFGIRIREVSFGTAEETTNI